MIRGIHHVAIHTPDLDRLVAWYRDVLGFEVAESTRGAWADAPDCDKITDLKDSAARYVMLRANNIFLEFFQYDRPQATNVGRLAPSDHGYTHICLDVTDAYGEYERLRRHGMSFPAPPVEFDGGRVRTIYGKDPDGNIIELQEVVSTDPMAVKTLPGYQFEDA
jgi:catechol 2,3-dioxygenase-like lactoylglutathione lyase family enzyme